MKRIWDISEADQAVALRLLLNRGTSPLPQGFGKIGRVACSFC